LEKETIGYVVSVYLSVPWKNSASTVRIFMKVDTGVFFENLSRKFQLSITYGKSNRDVYCA
jgi:hypothetical protein